MHFDIKKAIYLGGYKIKLFFQDKKSGIVDFENYPSRKGVFEKFKEIELILITLFRERNDMQI